MNNELSYEIITLAEKLYNKLKIKGLKISTAESCTGGMIGEVLTEIPGISEFYEYGFITYSNDAKQIILGVSSDTLSQYGAVSSQTVVEMANGAKSKSGSDVAISVSGIAGPGGGTALKPVGLVYAGFALPNGETIFKKLNLNGTRNEVRCKTVKHVLETMIDNI